MADVMRSDKGGGVRWGPIRGVAGDEEEAGEGGTERVAKRWEGLKGVEEKGGEVADGEGKWGGGGQ